MNFNERTQLNQVLLKIQDTNKQPQPNRDIPKKYSQQTQQTIGDKQKCIIRVEAKHVCTHILIVLNLESTEFSCVFIGDFKICLFLLLFMISRLKHQRMSDIQPKLLTQKIALQLQHHRRNP